MECLKNAKFKEWPERQTEISESFNLCDKNMESEGVPKFLNWPKREIEFSDVGSIRLCDKNMDWNPKEYQSFSKIGGSAKQSFQKSESKASICTTKTWNTKEYQSFSQIDWWERHRLELSKLGSINLRDKKHGLARGPNGAAFRIQKHRCDLRDDKIMEYEEIKKRVELRNIYYGDMDGENMESKGVPIYKVLASYILVPNVKRIEKFLNKLEEKGPKGTALATLRRSERLLFSDDYRYLLRPKVYKTLMIMYRRRGEKEDLRRLWNLAKNNMMLLDVKGYSHTIFAFLTKEDIEGAHEVLEGWDSTGIFHVEIRDLLAFRYHRKCVMEEAELVVEDMLEDHNEEEEKKKNRAMEVRQNGWDPKKNLVLSAYACVQYVEGRRDIESAVDVFRLLGTREPQDDSDRLSQKMAEAMIGGGYYGEQE